MGEPRRKQRRDDKEGDHRQSEYRRWMAEQPLQTSRLRGGSRFGAAWAHGVKQRLRRRLGHRRYFGGGATL